MIAAAIRAYVDDLRVVAPTRELAWRASRQMASRIQFLGAQDAVRKRRLDNGPWTGTVFSTTDGEITKSVTEAEWIKGKTMIQELATELQQDPNISFEFKRLERIRGFMCHLAMTYDLFFAYLKGFHLTLCQHLPQRDDQGWKLTDLEWIGFVEQRFQANKIDDRERDRLLLELPGSSINPPKLVNPVPRFLTCLQAIQKFFTPILPPPIRMRSTIFFSLFTDS